MGFFTVEKTWRDDTPGLNPKKLPLNELRKETIWRNAQTCRSLRVQANPKQASLDEAKVLKLTTFGVSFEAAALFQAHRVGNTRSRHARILTKVWQVPLVSSDFRQDRKLYKPPVP